MKKFPSRRQRNLARCVVLAALPACQVSFAHSSDPGVFRCETNGLCVRPDKLGGHSIVGGFRRGDEEIKFEMLYRPTTNPELPDWCQRLQDSHGQRIYTDDGPACPTNWATGSWDGNPLPNDVQKPTDRFVMLQQMLAKLKTGRAPEGRQDAWDRLTTLVEDVYESRLDDPSSTCARSQRVGASADPPRDTRATGAADNAGCTPVNVVRRSKKVSKFCELLRRVNGGFHPG